jgi:hypothetical protein
MPHKALVMVNGARDAGVRCKGRTGVSVFGMTILYNYKNALSQDRGFPVSNGII